MRSRRHSVFKKAALAGPGFALPRRAESPLGQSRHHAAYVTAGTWMFGTIAWQSQTVVLSRGGLLYFSKLDGPLGYEAPVTGNSVSVEKETKPQVHVGPKWYGAAWRGSVPGRLP